MDLGTNITRILFLKQIGFWMKATEFLRSPLAPQPTEVQVLARTRRVRGVRMVLHSKTALVTGASRGIGRATALALAETGAHVLVHYGRSAQEAQSLVESIHSKGGRADAIRADLGTPEGASLLANEVRSIVGKQLDLLVSNAGISKAATIKDHTVEEFDTLFATNVRSPSC